jgi:hypothetical protein
MVVGCVTTPIHGEALAHSRQASTLHVASTIGAGQEGLVWHEPHGSGDYCIARRHRDPPPSGRSGVNERDAGAGKEECDT